MGKQLQPGGRVGKMFTFDYFPGQCLPAASALGMAWTQGNHTRPIAVSHWGDYAQPKARVPLNSTIVSLKIDSLVENNMQTVIRGKP